MKCAEKHCHNERGYRTRCDSCAEKRNAEGHARYRAARAKGQCTRYGCPNETNGKSYCPQHMQAAIERNKELAHTYISAGLCATGCGEPLRSKRYCWRCRAKYNERNMLRVERYLAQGLCSNGCGRVLATKVYCRPCADHKNARDKAKRLKRSIASSAVMLAGCVSPGVTE